MNDNMKNDDIYNEDFFLNLNEIYKKQKFFLNDRIFNVLELILPVNKIRILDIGTANGLFAIECSKKGAFSIGVDLSKVALNNAQRFANKTSAEVRFICSDSSILPFRSNSFDMVILVDLVEHLTKSLYEKTIKECNRILKNGGRIAIYTPNKEHLIEKLRKRNLILSSFRGHINLMNMKEIVEVLENQQFLIEKAYFKPSHIPIFNKFELILAYLPIYGKLFKRRICVLGKKTTI